MLRRFGGDMVRVIAGYHAGAGAVERSGGIPPYPSTRRYVRKVLGHYMAYASSVPRTQVSSATARPTPPVPEPLWSSPNWLSAKPARATLAVVRRSARH